MKSQIPGLGETMSFRWVQVGVGAGLTVCILYPLVTMVSLPRVLIVVLAATLGPGLAVASLGLRETLRLHRESVVADLGALFNVLAGILLESMLLVQLAVRLRASDQAPSREIVGVWLGLDVAWDVYIGAGTACFALAMMRHPRFGRAMGITGLVLAAAVLGLNLFTFPTPPAEAGLVDVGPAVGLWYLVGTILMWRSMSWVRDRVEARNGRPLGT